MFFLFRRLTIQFLTFIALSLVMMHCGPGRSRISSPASRIPTIKVLLTDQAFVRIQLHGQFQLKAPEATYLISEKTGILWGQFQNGLLTLTGETRRWNFQSGFPIVIQPVNTHSSIEIENRKLFGSLYIIKVSEEIVYYVLHTDLERYLAGVVPAEIPTGNPGYKAAVEAQAIAARSYAWLKMRKNSDNIYHVKDNQWDQVLGDMTSANKIATAAIKDTRGMVLFSNNSHFIPYFHSTCGGMFLAFDGTDFSRVQIDAPATDSIAWCSISPLYRWYRIYDASDVINRIANTPLNPKEERNLNLRVLNRDKLGYIQDMEISVNKNRRVLSDYKIRTFFKDSLNKNLPSDWFFISPMKSDSTRLLFVGAGYGHGKGMCQWGAIGMSLAGYSVTDILSHYYPGITIRKLYP